jgi:NADP-dependent 3-hydroxy acid dehydrogenase YdfG
VNISNDEVNAFITALDSIKKIDYLVNAAGILALNHFRSYLEDYDSYQDLNRGFFYHVAAKKMKMVVEV